MNKEQTKRKDLSNITWGYLKVNYHKDCADDEGQNVIEVSKSQSIVHKNCGKTKYIIKDGAALTLLVTNFEKQSCKNSENGSIKQEISFEVENGSVALSTILYKMIDYTLIINANLIGFESKLFAKDAYILNKDEVLDLSYNIRLFGKNSECNIKSCGTLFDNTRKTQRATIDFVKGCTGSKGSESEDVLLLADNIVNKSLPILLCDEEDVQGFHTTTSGKLSEEKLFYMCSRGLSERQASNFVAKQRLLSVVATSGNKEVEERLLTLFEEEERPKEAKGNI